MEESLSLGIAVLISEFIEFEIIVAIVSWGVAISALLIIFVKKTKIIEFIEVMQLKVDNTKALLSQKRKRDFAERDGFTFGSLNDLRKESKKSSVFKGNDRVLVFQDIVKIANRYSDKRLLKALSLSPIQVEDWKTLKDFSELVRFTGDHAGYEEAIKSFDDKLTLISYVNSSNVLFVGSGLGQSTLNAYRKLSYSGTDYFEKIYLNDSYDLLRLLWFEENYRAHIDRSEILIPQVLKISKGRCATAVYFEFLNEPIDNCKAMPELAIKLALILYRQPVRGNSLPNYALSFESLDIYKSCFYLTKKWMTKVGLGNEQLLNTWQERVKTLHRQLSHGDLHGKNIGEPNILIDWDRAGYYPFGFDVAYALSNSYKIRSVESLYNYLTNTCIATIGDKEWKSFLFSCLFFCFLFFMRKLNSKIFDEQLKSLFYACNEAYERLPNDSAIKELV